uniref:Uncharacterized protein n=1 Tax=Chromera velia CCMP2878 TaxID=1169474 RepID=A0A0G4HYF3_9ALVE|mmetsp:Transcript_43083/g.84954  ORF Transcript_43083/g.84954 Transcript_43083/m.84954 type:complete len:120 (-) Transcript_43083:503-862(-)|eukprot:Cvel_9472.t1-p1 / transcript=Cvel_9472.t1 / gene=Cvel_9472 / organism=Chromera_velia_CCMP2878 / gene_product=hypothetical protein / transcript_product=hypothetical protein / location=Cvel_scaffold547:14899-15255(-) / protein_length=119 / sequence_SO=supercontig / SO=protein_coding / is_pseudo=false
MREVFLLLLLFFCTASGFLLRPLDLRSARMSVVTLYASGDDKRLNPKATQDAVKAAVLTGIMKGIMEADEKGYSKWDIEEGMLNMVKDKEGTRKRINEAIERAFKEAKEQKRKKDEGLS